MNKKPRLSGIKNIGQEETLVDRIIDYIQTEIAQDRLRPNQKIRENQIAKELKISRSPIREALRALERDGLVKLIPGRELTSLRSRRKMPVKYSCCVLTSSAWLFAWQLRS